MEKNPNYILAGTSTSHETKRKEKDFYIVKLGNLFVHPSGSPSYPVYLLETQLKEYGHLDLEKAIELSKVVIGSKMYYVKEIESIIEYHTIMEKVGE
jgi:hypothetical protein